MTEPSSRPRPSDLEALSLLAEPARRALYDHVVQAEAEVDRDAAAEAVGVSRSLAAFHLDKLVDAGLLAVTYRRRSARTGPGAGRPAKFYRRADGERAVSLPPRTYGAAARLLVEVVEQAGLDRELAGAARRAGEAAGAEAAPGGPAQDLDRLLTSLADQGYQPYVDGADGSTVRLRNCPFHVLAVDYPPLVCGMNLALLEGLLAGLGVPASARLAPRRDGCCVVISKS